MRRLPVVGWLTVVVCALSIVASAAPAQAHASQTGSTPAAGAVLEAPPAEVVVEFDTPLLDIGAAIVVRTSDGTVVSTGAPILGRRSIAVAIMPDAPDGAYTAAYRVVSQDGHTVESTFDFRVGDVVETPTATAPPASEPPRTPEIDAAGTDGPPLALIGVGLLALTLVVAGAIALRR